MVDQAWAVGCQPLHAMKSSSSFLTVVVFATGLACCPHGEARVTAPPNVLLVLTDDQGFGDIGLHGNPWLRTPVMDRLAGEGARLNHFYVSAVCAPTRASLLTGRYAPRSGVRGVARGQEIMRTEEVTLAEMLHAAGYATGIFGKWHNGENYPCTPNAQGFDEFFGFCAGGVYQYFDAEYQHNLGLVREPGYISDVLTNRAIDFIRANRDRPFLCYMAFNAPHSPWQVPDRYFDRYRKLGLEDSVAAVYGMIESIDDNLGRLLAVLEETGLEENTIVIFLGDNGPIGAGDGLLGPGRYDAGLKGIKAGPDEGSMRVPCFVRWAGHIPKGKVIEDLAAHIDILPTLVKLCGVPLPSVPLDGQDLSARLLGESALPHAARKLFERNTVRTERWRLTLGQAGPELYDIASDPGQHRNVAAREPELTARLEQFYREWEHETGLDRPLRVPPVIPVGYPEAPSANLPTPYADKVHARMNTPYSQGYFERWESPDGHLDWPIDVQRPGKYRVRVWYVCPPAALGTRLRAEFPKASVELDITQAQDPTPLSVQDRVPQTQGNIKAWIPATMGEVQLQVGEQNVRLCPVRLVGPQPGVEIKRLELIYLP
jgi:arylsulfatase A